MTDIPIIFSAPMVRALLDGRKSMTRRLAFGPYIDSPLGNRIRRPSLWQRVKPGDRLWVRENARIDPEACEGWPYDAKPCRGWIDYQAGGESECDAPDFDAVQKMAGKDADWDCLPLRYRPSIHMPRWASRLTLRVTAVKVERLQGISRDDAIAEGLFKLPATGRYVIEKGAQYLGVAHRDPRLVFCSLWSALHGDESWDANPEVVAVSFDVIRANIDQMQEAA